MSIYSDKLAHIQVVINCQFSVAQMCTWEDTHARLFTRAVLADITSQNELTTKEWFEKKVSTFQQAHGI